MSTRPTPTTTAYTPEPMAPYKAAPCRLPVVAPAVSAAAISTQSETVSASLAERYAAVVRARQFPVRSACAR